MVGDLPRPLLGRGYGEVVMQDASIIIVTYNAIPYLADCLNSVISQNTTYTYEIVIVDNASSDATALTVQSLFPTVTLIELDQNVGFAAANNIGVARSHGETIVALNQDTVVASDWLQILLDGFDVLPDACLLAANQFPFSQSSRLSFPSDYVNNFEISYYGFVELHSYEIEDSYIKTNFASGGAFAVQRASLMDLGMLFDPAFFMYGEDLDLSLRVTRHGGTIYLVKDARVLHASLDGSVGVRDFGRISSLIRKTILAQRNRFWAYQRNLSHAEFLSMLPRLTFGAPLKFKTMVQSPLLFFCAFPFFLCLAIYSLFAFALLQGRIQR